MKLKCSLFVLYLCAIMGCSTSKYSTEEKFDGSWNWIGSSGRIDGRTETHETTAKTMKLRFSKFFLEKHINTN